MPEVFLMDFFLYSKFICISKLYFIAEAERSRVTEFESVWDMTD